MNKETKIYNILFPAWMFFLLPTAAWLVIIPGNFAIDSLVTLLGLKHLGVEERMPVYKKSIVKTWLFGFLSDFVGAGLIMLIMFALDAWAPNLDLFYFPGATLLAVPGVILAGVLIYVLNRKFAFRGTGLDDETIRRISRILAIFTTPYLMLIPLYG